jgi:hypothetical protein
VALAQYTAPVVAAASEIPDVFDELGDVPIFVITAY